MLIPMYFIIGIWGGQEKIYAAVKFFLYTMAGSLLMLVAILWLGYYASTLPGGRFTADLMKLYQIGPSIPSTIQSWMFLAFTVSFAIKFPLFPFHTWLPDAHVEAPTAGSVILAGVLLKMGTYGLLRFSLPLFPYAAFEFTPLLCVLALVGIIYGALVAMVQSGPPGFQQIIAARTVEVLARIRAPIEADLDNCVSDLHAWKVSSNQLGAIVSVVTSQPRPAAYYKGLLAGIEELAHVTVSE
jgi:NADH-quinone oxidoreductase subunit M